MTGSYSAKKNLSTEKYSTETRTRFFEKNEYAGWSGRIKIKAIEGPQEVDCCLTGLLAGGWYNREGRKVFNQEYTI
jgi:hypothetical protein